MTTTTYEQERTDEQRKYDEKVMKRVKRGMRLMEQEYGPDWVDQLDLATFDITDGDMCVLGQLEGAYDNSRWANRIFDAEECAAAHGFTISNRYPYGASASRQWRELQKAWERTLTPLVHSR